MKTTTIKVSDLRNAIARVRRGIAGRTVLPVTNYFLLNVGKDKATLSGTDLEKMVITEVKADTEEAFDILLPPRTVAQFVNARKDKKGNESETITVSVLAKEKVATFERAGYGTMKVQLGIEAKDFPPMPEAEPTATWATIDGQWLCRMIGIVDKSCDHSDRCSRPVLGGVVCKKGTMAAADGFRLTVAKDDRLDFGWDKSVILPHKTVVVMKQLWDGVTGDIEVSVQKNGTQVRMKGAGTTLISQVVQGTFPDFQQLVPATFSTAWTFSGPELCERLSLIDPSALRMGSGIVRFSENSKEPSKLAVSAHIEEFGDYDLAVTVKSEGEQESRIAFNYKYLLDAAKDFALCRLETSNQSSPGKLTGDIDGLTVVVMPMFVQW